jgi:hypothetical protein
MVEKLLESTQAAPEPLRIKTKNDTVITIHPHHVGFFESLLLLPVSTKIQLLGLTAIQLQNHIIKEKKQLHLEVVDLLQKTWLWKETGDEVEFVIDTIPGVPFTLTEMKSQKRTLGSLIIIKEFLTGDDREVYTNN